MLLTMVVCLLVGAGLMYFFGDEVKSWVSSVVSKVRSLFGA